MDSSTTAYLLIAIVVGIIVLEEMLRKFGHQLRRKDKNRTIP